MKFAPKLIGLKGRIVLHHTSDRVQVGEMMDFRVPMQYLHAYMSR